MDLVCATARVWFMSGSRPKKGKDHFGLKKGMLFTLDLHWVCYFQRTIFSASTFIW